MSLISVDLPEPDTPVTQVSSPIGMRHVEVAQVVAAWRRSMRDPLIGAAWRRWLGTEMQLAARQVRPGQRRRLAAICAGVPCGDHLAAVDAGAGTQVDDMIGGADRVLIVLDDDHGIAEVAQALERAAAAARLSR